MGGCVVGQMNIISCPLEGVFVVEPRVFGDERGYFFESYNERDMIAAGLDLRFVQDNQSMSRRGVMRGMHFQTKHPQGKLVQVLQGRVYDVVVDIRKGSPTYGQYFGLELSSDDHRQLYVAPGLAHGYLTLSDYAVFAYKTSDFYHPEDEGGILWNDPEIGIQWPEIAEDGTTMLDGTPLNIIERDRQWPTLRKLHADSLRI